jgi:hypothetical protein
MSSGSASAFRSLFVRSVVDVHNRSQLPLFHLHLSLPLPCPLPLISLLHPLTPTSYYPPPYPVLGNPPSHIVPHMLFLMFSPRSLDEVLSTTSRRAAAFEQQIKALEVRTAT